MNKWLLLAAGTVVVILGTEGAAAETRMIGDVRGGLYVYHTDNRDGTETRDEDLRVRLRAGVETDFSAQWRGTVRLAGHYSDEMVEKRFSLHSTNESRPFGQSTFDMLNIRYALTKSASVTVGRMQTKFELEGVPKKSLDRNDSPNVDIDFTDGVHAVYGFESGWKAHLILQRNPSLSKSQLSLAANIVRGPLDFTDGSSRVTTFAALENKTKSGVFVQRGVDITYIQDALLVTGSASGGRDDYLAIVGRTALAWPMGPGKEHFLLGLEAGYAPNTHRASAVSLAGSDDVKGYAWQASFNLMEFAPRHNIGLVWGEAQAGWLISPDFRENERLIEVRHQYVFNKQLSLESRIRQRKELEKLTTAIRERDDRDLYVRLTYKF